MLKTPTAPTALISPQAAIPSTSTTDYNDRWYQAKAATDASVDISIVGDIGAWGITAQQFIHEVVPITKGKTEINVHLHSLGGDILDGLAIYNFLKHHPATVNVYIAGIAASMGSVIACAGDTVYIPENAWIMVHKPWGAAGGDANDVREYADLLDKYEASMMVAYTDKTGKSAEELAPMLAVDTWLMGQDAIDHGFADKITDAVELSASISNNRTKDYENMPAQAKKLLISAQASAGSSSTPPPAQGPSGGSNNPLSADEQRKTFIAEGKARQTEIKAAFAGFEEQHQDLLNTCLIDNEITVAQAKDKLLAALGAQPQPATGGHRIHAAAHASNGNIVKDSMVAALGARCSLITPDNIERDNPFIGMSLQEMARMSLTERGVSAYGVDRLGMIGMAFTHTSSDFGEVLSDVAQKALLKGYIEAAETFRRWTVKGNLSDFKISKRVGLESFPTLDEVPDGGQYKHATLNDSGEMIQLATYGKMFDITRQTIINDDLSAFTTIPQKMGRAADRTVGNLVYAVLTSNVKMTDGKSLFHADHNNLMSAAGLSMKALDEAGKAMALQEDSAGAVLNIEPAFLIVPRALRAQATTLMESPYDPDGKHSTSTNTAHKMAEVISDARIDKAFKDQAMPWYLAASTASDTIEVAYLDGNDKPYIEQQAGWNIDGTQFKVRLDAGVSPLSSKTLLKNPGVK